MKKPESCNHPQGGIALSDALRSLAQPIDLRDQIRELFGLNLMALTELPESCTDISILRSSLNSRLLSDFFTTWLSDKERKQVKSRGGEGFLPQHLRHKWDQYILEEAVQQYGARLLLSDHVMARVWAWARGEEAGSVKLEKLFGKMRHSARIGLGLAKGTITNLHRRAKKPFVAKLALLQLELQHAWPEGRTATESAEKIRQFIAQRIESDPALLTLIANREQLFRFLDDDGKALAFRGEKYSEDALTPTQFCVEWFAWSEKLSTEYARQRLVTKAPSQPGKE
ncbi:hypothetical protein SBA2_900006 [Acidobacteriia bacterium SbA2]|nr:hypothetical protein SBA2_900006 [Acidobacteriia bacterium SbA2]